MKTLDPGKKSSIQGLSISAFLLCRLLFSDNPFEHDDRCRSGVRKSRSTIYSSLSPKAILFWDRAEGHLLGLSQLEPRHIPIWATYTRSFCLIETTARHVHSDEHDGFRKKPSDRQTEKASSEYMIADHQYNNYS